MQSSKRMLPRTEPADVPNPVPLDQPEHVELERTDAWRTWQLFWMLERARRRRFLSHLRRYARL